MVGKGIRSGICHGIRRYAKVDNKFMKNYDKNKESSYLKYGKYGDVSNSYGWEMSQKLSVDGLSWVEETSH